MTPLLLAMAFVGHGQALSDTALKAEAQPEAYPPPTGLVDLRRVDEHTICLHFRDGYVIHHTIGQKRSDEKLVLDHPLDVKAASDPGAFTVDSADDAAFKGGKPLAVHRKTKGTEFAWFVDNWVNGKAVNNRPDYAAEHWIYLSVGGKLEEGKSYRVLSQKLGVDAKLKLDAGGSLTESVHVNLLGYRPDAPQKFGYLYAWEGDGGSMDVKPYDGRSFRVVEASSGATAYSSTVKFRDKSDNPETGDANMSPNNNFLAADVAECDFSALQKPGSYYLEIDGVGRSRVFAIQPDIYRQAFKTTMLGILGNRSGIDLEPPYVSYSRPAPHNTLLTPGFKGMLKYTKSRYIDRTSPDASADDTPAVKAGIVGDLDVAGWYQDAGDWDSYESHIAVPQNLMLAYRLAPANFKAGELNLPGKPSPLPDILKEAEWLPSFCYRLRHQLMDRKYGTGGLGLRICGDYFGGDEAPDGAGQGSWQDVHRIWTASGEDPVSTFGYAGVAADFALCLKEAKTADPLGIDWTKEAAESFDWAATHTRPGDEKKGDYQEYRIYALSGLALLTGEARYEKQLEEATASFGEGTRLWWAAIDGPALYLATPAPNKSEFVMERFRKAMLGTADASADSASKRALRWAGDWGMPMLIGQQTTPWIAPLAVASVITRQSDPQKSRAYFGVALTTADYFLGTNSLNQTWVSGLGPRFPRDPFSLDGWYVKGTYPRPGIVPYGPWQKSQAEGAGPWDLDWANKSVYPPIDQWPGAERWFNNRCCPLTNEFTIHQNIAPSALAYGFLCGAAS